MSSEKRLEKIKNVVAQRQRGLTVVLEDVHDPHNAEAILRSCDAFGVQTVCLIFNQQDPYNPRKVGNSSSSSANKWLDFRIFHHVKDCCAALKEEGYTLFATVADDGAESVYTTALVDSKMALLVGNEHRGLSKEMLAFADKKITLPMCGMVQSFNVSVATALFLYEVTRQRIVGEQEYVLSEQEQQQLREDFYSR